MGGSAILRRLTRRRLSDPLVADAVCEQLLGQISTAEAQSRLIDDLRAREDETAYGFTVTDMLAAEEVTAKMHASLGMEVDQP